MCTCQECKRKYNVDILISDYLWEIIKPKNKPIGGGMLCGNCIIQKIEKFGYSAYELKRI